jgi:hypothetical protein
MPSLTFGNITSNIITITYDSESGTYTTQTSIQQPISYNETETEQPISTKLVAGSLLVSINYNDETESYSITPSITQTITYKDLENIHIETKADIILSYSEKESEVLEFTYSVPTISYNEGEQYLTFSASSAGSSTGTLTNYLNLTIPFSQGSYIQTTPKYTVTASFNPPNSNVQTVTNTATIQNDISFTFSITAAADTTTYVVTATVTDSASNAIPNALVTWTATGGTVSPATSTTNSSGEATTTASTSSVVVTASVTLLGVTKTASATT